MSWTIGQLMAGEQASKALKAGATLADIQFSEMTGIDPNDVITLRSVTLHSRLLLITRCPPTASLAWHGKLPPKFASQKGKSNPATGVAIGTDDRWYVSDYDLMSIWRVDGKGQRTKVVVTGRDAYKRSSMSEEATELLRSLNARMVSRFQHGCQDDWDNHHNRGVKADDTFAVFCCGRAEFIPNRNEMHDYYRKYGMEWPYNQNGQYQTSFVMGLS